jgi:hypothetical protein
MRLSAFRSACVSTVKLSVKKNGGGNQVTALLVCVLLVV